MLVFAQGNNHIISYSRNHIPEDMGNLCENIAHMTIETLKTKIAIVYAKRFNLNENEIDSVQNHMRTNRNMVIPGLHPRLQIYVEDFQTVYNNKWLTTPVY